MHKYMYTCTMYLDGILRPHLCQDGSKQFLPLLQYFGILSQEVARYGQLHITLVQEGIQCKHT